MHFPILFLFIVSFHTCTSKSDIESDIINAMQEFLEEDISPGIGLGYLSDKAVSIIIALGEANTENKVELKKSTLYPIQSVSKMFISILT